MHDALCAVSRTLESNAVVPGGGAVETALSLHLEEEMAFGGDGFSGVFIGGNLFL